MKTQPYSPWLHRYAVFVAFSTFILIIAGALVTSNDAGLSVPDWPTSFGSFRMPRMVGGVMFEHGHRMIAGTVGILTIILALLIWLSDSRRWIKWVAGGAVLAVLAQAALGGITVLFYLPVAVSTSHATLGQIFFCLTASLAFFTRAGWRWDEPKLEDPSVPTLRLLTAVTTGIILVQLVVGAVYRHSGKGLELHIAGAGVVTMFVAYLVTRILLKFPQAPQVLKPALFVGGLLVVQISLGIASYVVKMADRNAPQPLPPVVNTTTAHVAVGALVLLSSLYLTYQTHRFLAPRVEESKAVSAPHGAAV